MNNEIVTLLNGLDGYMEKIGRPQVSDSRVAKEKAAAKTVQKAKVGPPSFGFVRLRSPFFGGGAKCGMWRTDRRIGGQSVAWCRFASQKFFLME